MATIHKDFKVAVSAAQAWDAVRDFGALHERLVPPASQPLHISKATIAW